MFRHGSAEEVLKLLVLCAVYGLWLRHGLLAFFPAESTEIGEA